LQAVFFMLKVCKCRMDVWSVMLNFLCAIECSFSWSTSNIDHRRPIRERINVNKNWTNTSPLWRPGLRNWSLLKGRRVPAASQCTLIANVRTVATAQSPSKSAIWNQDSARVGWVNLSQHRPAWLKPTVLCRWPSSTTPSTGDLTARGYCSFQETKCDKKLTSVRK